MNNGNELDDLNKRLLISVKDLKDIKDEKEELKQDPEKNADRIKELDYREEAKIDEINQIRDDKAKFEPGLESSLSDKMQDLGEDMKDGIEKIGEKLSAAKDAVKEWLSNVDGSAAKDAGVEVVNMLGGQVREDEIKAPEPPQVVEQYQHEIGVTVVEDAKDKDLKTPQEIGEDIKKDFDNKIETLNDAPEIDNKEKGNEPELEKNLEKGDDKHTQRAEPNKEDLKSMLVDYHKDYYKELRQSGSYEQAAEKATNNLVDKLENQKDPNQKDDNKEKENNNEKATELIKAQYGDTGKEDFEKIKEQEKQKEQERQKEQEKSQNQDKSR